MSERPIQVGDLVVVVRGRKCGCASDSDGVIYRVDCVAKTAEFYSGCFHPGWEGLRAFSKDKRHRVELHRLKRIPPLEDLQTFRNTDENPVHPVFDSTLDIMSGKVKANGA